MKDEQINYLSGLLKSMAHPTRLKILCLLQDREMTVSDLRQALHTTDANISQHLAILRHQGITETRREANFIHNRIKDHRVLQLISSMQDLYCSISNSNGA